MSGANPLPGQFCITKRDTDAVPDGFRSQTISGWEILYDADFSTRTVVDGGTDIGFVFGEMLRVTEPASEVRVGTAGASDDETIGESFERYLNGFAGRFVGVVDTGSDLRVYTDPGGTLPVVYSTDEETVAASPLSLPRVAQSDHFRRGLFESVSSEYGGWLPGELTYYRGVKQLLPNHYFDLREWEPKRHYSPESTEFREAKSVIAEVVEHLRAVIRRVVQESDGPVASLTAGHDSRGLLACARRWIASGELSTYTYMGEGYELDKTVAYEMSTDHGFELDIVPVRESDSADERQFLEKTGYGITSRTKDVHTTMRYFKSDAQIQGLGGEIGRGYYWKETDGRETTIGPQDLLRRFHKPEHPEFLRELERWLAEIEHLDAYAVLDLAYQEHRLGRWGGPQHLGKPSNVDHYCPFMYRPVVDLLYELPVDVRRNDELAERIVERTWPELNDYPYNSYTGWRKYRERSARIKKGVLNPGEAVRFLLHRV